MRNRENPYCCGAGGGLLFADKEEEPGSRISDVRFKQLQDTGAATVVTACPFCSIMLKGAQTSAPAGSPGADIQFVDLMTLRERQVDAPCDRGRLAGIPVEAHPGGRHRSRGLPARRLAWPRPFAGGRPGLEHLEAVAQSGRQPIMAFWHGRILPATLYFRGRGIVVITSENFDGEWIAGIIERFGYGTARGSSSRGGRRALLQLKRDMAAGHPAAFTVDGPRGPGRVAQPGAVWLAKATGHPVLPFHIEASRHWTLGAGTARRFRSRLPRWRLRSASRSTCRRTR